MSDENYPPHLREIPNDDTTLSEGITAETED
jgi:hypothetical protein